MTEMSTKAVHSAVYVASFTRLCECVQAYLKNNVMFGMETNQMLLKRLTILFTWICKFNMIHQ